jgi:biotin carboxyl carrier protein
MKYRVALDGTRVSVEVLERDGRRVVRVNGTEAPADFRLVQGKACYSLLVGDASYPVSFERRPDGLSVTVLSESYVAQVEDERAVTLRAAAGARGAAAASRTIHSMMPGIVREIRVAPGDAVKAGQPLLILEAMKMQNEIRAAADGAVKTVHVRPDSTVNKGDPLVTFGDVLNL